MIAQTDHCAGGMCSKMPFNNFYCGNYPSMSKLFRIFFQCIFRSSRYLMMHKTGIVMEERPKFPLFLKSDASAMGNHCDTVVRIGTHAIPC